MKLMLIGCGALGLGFAAALYQSGESPDLIARGETGRAIAQEGIARIGVLGEVRIPAQRMRVFPSPAETGRTGYDFVLVSTKTTASESVAAQLGGIEGLLAPGGRIALLQNGFSNEEAYLRFFQKEQMAFGFISIGFRRPRPNVSEVTVYSGPAGLGSLFGGDVSAMRPLADAVTAGGIPTQVQTDIGKLLWSKMLYNCTLNPLGALLGVNYGKLAESAHARAVMDRVIGEVFCVMHAAGYETFWPDAQAYQKEFYEKILPPTYGHRSSTLQDVERRIKTEIGSLNGLIVRLGERHGIDVPCNRMLCDLIGATEDYYL